MKSVGVIRFPGTNCDRDVIGMVKQKNLQPIVLWHRDLFEPASVDAVILPGGFSYGDYLRSGALAARSPVMNSVREFARRGGPILGICNGFQILTESGLLPGALLKNARGRFCDEWVSLKVQNPSAYWSKKFTTKELRLPIAHGDGRFHAAPDLLKQLHDKNQIWLKYAANPNGSVEDIAGVTDPSGKIAALMPHPERAILDWMGGTDGWNFL